MRGKTLRVGEGAYAGSTNAAIQRAVDDLAAEGGGSVELPSGTFEMWDGLHLRSGVRVVGQGPRTVLRKVPSVSSPIADYLGYGHYEVTLERPDLLRPGMGVIVEDDDAAGFYTTTATLLAREGNAFLLDRMLNHDYHPDKNGRVTSVFPLVAGEGVEDVVVAGLTLDGANDPVRINGCRAGGVFLLRARTATVEAVEVVNYNGDAVSFQQCVDVVVRDCHLHHNAGIGLHPGSGSVRYLIAGNDVHDNGGDALFYCLRTTHSLCERNRLHANGGAGISIGERDTDHMIRGNEISDNGGPGVLFRDPVRRGGNRVVLDGNRFARNCRDEGDAEVVIAAGIEEVVLRGNEFCEVRAKAVRVGGSARRISLVGNKVAGRACSADDVVGAAARLGAGEAGGVPLVGPAAAGAGSARHLSVELTARPANFDLPRA